MGIDDVVNKSKEFLEQNKEKIEQALRSDKAEHVSDSVINAAAEFVKKITPESAHAKVDSVREKVDGAVGGGNAGGSGAEAAASADAAAKDAQSPAPATDKPATDKPAADDNPTAEAPGAAGIA
ncbi:Rv0909 family putative TA system antitoxin [Microbacterium sp. zg-Y818]|uniref:Rv0909 family putative TA system antitoxin n=1 Tax=unclassified Microbacterium TaxID=2609290 RepID=UPI00214C730C|nr:MULTISPECIES: Rv0909 family putative TA system antitoxin [unclassified Microbacterium]MCR2802228.1 Rv0909 family putative TA system antitoxin [Microbacterium sp. zg.Y818]WIM22771.1 Rv0909 family putative TA system antitoxin [Microbacterium sp. zg-Y818]